MDSFQSSSLVKYIYSYSRLITISYFSVTVGAGVKEVSFSTDAHAVSNSASSGLSTAEYSALAVCSVLLGLIYVSSVLLYLHMRRRKGRELQEEDRVGGGGHLGAEEGIIKNNPLLRHCHENSGYISDNSCCSGQDDDDEIAALPDDEPSTPPPINVSDRHFELTLGV